MKTAIRLIFLVSTYALLSAMAWARVIVRFFHGKQDDPHIRNDLTRARKAIFLLNVHSYAMTVFTTYLNGYIVATTFTTGQSIMLSSSTSILTELLLDRLDKRLNLYRLHSDGMTVETFLHQYLLLGIAATGFSCCINEMLIFL